MITDTMVMAYSIFVLVYSILTLTWVALLIYCKIKKGYKQAHDTLTKELGL